MRTVSSEPHPEEEEELPELTPEQDPGAIRRFRFRHPTASGKTIAAAGFVEAARTARRPHPHPPAPARQPVRRDLTETGYAKRLADVILRGASRSQAEPDHDSDLRLVRAPPRRGRADRLPARDLRRSAHGAGREDQRRIRAFPEPDLHRHDRDRAADRQAGLRRLPRLGRRPAASRRRPPRRDRTASLSARPAGCGDPLGPDRRRRFRRARAGPGARPHGVEPGGRELYRDRFDDTPGIVYAAGVKHAYNLAQEFRAAGLNAEAVSGRTPPVKLAETLAAYERGEINVLINAKLLAEGWNSPRATICMHLAPTASRRVYQQRVGRIMRTHRARRPASSSTSCPSRPHTARRSSRFTRCWPPTSTERVLA